MLDKSVQGREEGRRVATKGVGGSVSGRENCTITVWEGECGDCKAAVASAMSWCEERMAMNCSKAEQKIEINGAVKKA